MACELRKLGARWRTARISWRRPRPPLARRRHPHLRRPPHRDVLLAGRFQPGGACRCASWIRSAWPRPFPTTSKRCSGRSHEPARIPVICIDGPTPRARARWPPESPAALGYHYLDSGALYRITALAAVARRAGARRGARGGASRRWPSSCRCGSQDGPRAAGRRGHLGRDPHRGSRG